MSVVDAHQSRRKEQTNKYTPCAGRQTCVHYIAGGVLPTGSADKLTGDNTPVSREEEEEEEDK